MRTIIFSWEYPPRIVGQLAQYVNKLTSQLVKNNVETYVVTYHDFLTDFREEANGVKIFRVTNPVATHINHLTWVLTLNQEVERAAANFYYQEDKKIDLIDVHDWHFMPAAVVLKNAFKIPFVYSVESLEDHRSVDTSSPFSMAIKSIEGLGFLESDIVTAKSEWMLNEIVRLFKIQKMKIRVTSPHTNLWIKEVLDAYRAATAGDA